MEGKRWQGTLNVALAGAFAVAAAIAGKQSITVSQQVHEISKLQEQSVGEASQCNSERDDLKANLARCRTDLAQCQTNLSTARTPVQPSGLPAAAQGSADLAAEPLQVTESDFTFSDPECRLSGSEITCGITVLNKAEERTLHLADAYSGSGRIVDQRGNEYLSQGASLGAHSGGFDVSANLPRNIPLRGGLIFRDVKNLSPPIRLFSVPCMWGNNLHFSANFTKVRLVQ
jgi:hypothetical protein